MIYLGKRRYNIKIWKIFTDCFNCLPVCAIIDEKIICMHGGLSPDLNKIDLIHKILRPCEVPDTGKIVLFIYYSLLIDIIYIK